MTFATYSMLMWSVSTTLYAALILLCWRQGIHQLLPRFVLFIGWDLASTLGSYPVIVMFGQGSSEYITYYYLSGAVRNILQALALLEIARMTRVRVGSWVWAGAAAVALLFAVSIRSAPGVWVGTQLFQAGFLHLSLWLLMGIMLESLRESSLRLGWNAAGVLILVFVDLGARYALFVGQVFIPIDYSLLRWLFQPATVISLAVALACMRRLEAPVFLDPRAEAA